MALKSLQSYDVLYERRWFENLSKNRYQLKSLKGGGANILKQDFESTRMIRTFYLNFI